MRAENHYFVGLLVTTNFANDIVLLDRSANFVWHGYPHSHCLARGHEPCHMYGVFPRHYSLRVSVDFAIQLVAMPVEQQPFSCVHPQDCASAAFYCSRNDAWRPSIFAE